MTEIKDLIPVALKGQEFIFEPWQWLGLVILLATFFIIEKVVDKVAHFLISKNVAIISAAPKELLPHVIKPAGKILFLALVLSSLPLLELEKSHELYMKRGIYILLALCMTWFMHRFVQIMSYYFKEKVKDTETKFDDILVPLLTKSAYMIVYAIGFVLVANALTINITGIIAGLGIGGLAFAFAAKDTIANFFGSIMLVLDRPFDIGDMITAGSLEGTVVEVGFRSTRIRTFYDSIITVSNGELMNLPIDNKGKRRYRRLNTTLGLEYDTPAEKIEAFCEGIRQLILNHKWTRKDNFNVYFTGFGASSLDIQLMVFWETSDYSRECAERHRLMIDILRLAKEVGVDFAFPTQTVHLFREEKIEKPNWLEKYIDEGIDRAQKIVKNPISLKNPRSNAGDESQFGKNDIGLD